MRALAPEATGLTVWLAAALIAGGMVLGWAPAPDGAAAQSSTHQIRGNVSGPSGEPLQGIAVQARGEFGEDTFGPWSALPTNAEGNFEIEVPDGTFRLHLSLESAGSGACFLGYFGSDGKRARYGQVERVVVAGDDVEGLDIILSGHPSERCHEVEGVVVDSEGQPVVRRQVSFGGWWEWGRRSHWTDAKGTFRLHLWEGRYLIEVGTELGGECTVEGYEGVDPGRPAVIDVDGGVHGLRITLSTGTYADLTSVRCFFPPRMATTTLRPGWNLAGWTAEETDAGALFDVIPALEAVSGWDAGTQSFERATRGDPAGAGDLTTIAPGMGLWLRLSGEEPVTWTRPAAPAGGFVSLQPGWNLVAWAGRDGAAPEDAFAFLGEDLLAAAAWESVAGEFRRYYPGAPSEVNTLRRLELGEALWLKVGAARRWLQPGAAAPAVEFVSYFSPEQRETLQVALDDIVAYFAERLGIAIPGLTVRFGDDSVQSGGAYRPGNRTIYMRSYTHIMSPTYNSVLAHEYGHAAQHYLAGPDGWGPVWLYESVATHWAAQYQHLSGRSQYSEYISEVIASTRQGNTPLQEGETRAGLSRLQGKSGQLAVDWLVDLAGADSLRYYFSLRSLGETWQDSFREAFGLEAHDFYPKFEEYRSRVAPSYAKRVAGVVLGPGGQPEEGVRVQYFSSEHDAIGLYGGRTDDEGRFSWAIDGGSYFVGLAHGEDCPLPWYTTDDRIGLAVGNRARIDVGEVDIQGLTLTLSRSRSEVCREVQGVITDLEGNPRAGVYVFPLEAETARLLVSSQVITDGSGTFVITIPRGHYRLQVRPPTVHEEFGGLGYYGGEAGLVLRRSEARLIDTGAATLPEIVIASGAIGGTILTAEGQPLEGVAVHPGERTSLPPTSDSQGRFQVAVSKGAHTLELVCPQGGGGWYGGPGALVGNQEQATPIVVDTADVTGIVITVPAGVRCE